MNLANSSLSDLRFPWGRGMEDPVQGRELSQRRISLEPRRSYLEARVWGSQGTHTGVRL